jgi:hypothetical protein
MDTRPSGAVYVCFALGALCGQACTQTVSPPGTGPASSPASVPTASSPSSAPAPESAPALDARVDEILTRLEKRDVTNLHARLSWRQRYVIDAEQEAVTKTGEIWYQKGKPTAKFLIHFTGKLAGGRADKLDERHLFDGQWYVELQSRTKTVTRREVRRPNDPSDPYKVGQGVFPLPFGQQKGDILREFDVTRASPAPDDPPGTDHLRLVPHKGTQTAERYKQVDFWVAQAGPTEGLPVRVQVAKLSGTGTLDSYITIAFTDANLERELPPGLFEIKTPPGYDEPPPERLDEPPAPARGQP